MIKALFFDLDGTMTDVSGRLAPHIVEILKICREKGIRVFTATARPPMLRENTLLDPEESLLGRQGVFYNGSCICFNNVCEYSTLPETALLETIRILSSYPEIGLHIQLANEKHCFLHKVTKQELARRGISKEELLPFKERTNHNAVKAILYHAGTEATGGPLPYSLFQDLAAAIGKETDLLLTDMGKQIQIGSKGTSKKLAIDQIRERYFLKKDEIAIFGDNYTDVEIMKEYPYSFAMGNASEEIKSYAKFVISGNSEEAIYSALKRKLRLL